MTPHRPGEQGATFARTEVLPMSEPIHPFAEAMAKAGAKLVYERPGESETDRLNRLEIERALKPHECPVCGEDVVVIAGDDESIVDEPDNLGMIARDLSDCEQRLTTLWRGFPGEGSHIYSALEHVRKALKCLAGKR